MYLMNPSNYLLIAISVAGVTWFIGGIFRKYTLKKFMYIVFALIIFSGIISYLVILFETIWGNHVPPDIFNNLSDEITTRHGIPKPAPVVAFNYLVNNAWEVIVASVAGIITGSVISLVKDYISLRGKEKDG